MFRTRFPVLRRYLLGALLVALFSAASVLAGGVTIITHGFNSNVTDWIIPMAGKILAYPSFPGATYSCYQISITRSGSGQYLYASSFLGGAPPLLTDSGEILVKLDWSSVSNIGGASSTQVAQATVNALLDTGLIPALGGRPLVELPLHFVGHSRGGSVISEMARLLGAQGLWVDQVTTLDPRPVATFGDAAVTTWTNVLFADNFWQNMGDGIIVPNGRSSALITASCSISAAAIPPATATSTFGITARSTSPRPRATPRQASPPASAAPGGRPRKRAAPPPAFFTA